MNILQTSKVKIKLSFLISILVLISMPQFSIAEISTNSYCQLTIAEMQQQISNYQALISLANQFRDDPTALAQQEAIIRAQFDQEKEARYSSFGTTAQEYVLYMGKNETAVKAYLENNPDVKQQIDDLSDQLKALMDEHQAVKESIINQEPPPLP
ncbi:MAG: hypothetical protein KKC46_06325 [Proteobacteria bacterium]|nr:hypothetical protein [Pseudomonadota bacterium]